MAVSSPKQSSTVSKKMWTLGIAVVVAVALYTGGWFFAADKIKQELALQMKAQGARGLTVECGNMDVRGYPFRFELFCTKPALADLSAGGSVDVGALRTAAQVYAPWHVVWEADGPMEATLPTGEKITANWQSLQSSLQLKLGGLERSSIASDGLDIVLPTGEFETATMKIAHGEAHIRQQDGNLEMAALAKDMNLVLPGSNDPKLPTVSASIEATLAGKAGALEGNIRGKDVIRPVKGELTRLVADFGEGRVATVNGPIEVDEAGLISGTLSVEIEKFADWQPMLQQALPQNASQFESAMGAIKAMADQKGTVRVNLVLSKGQVMLGFIPLGITLPPV